MLKHEMEHNYLEQGIYQAEQETFLILLKILYKDTQIINPYQCISRDQGLLFS